MQLIEVSLRGLLVGEIELRAGRGGVCGREGHGGFALEDERTDPSDY